MVFKEGMCASGEVRPTRIPNPTFQQMDALFASYVSPVSVGRDRGGIEVFGAHTYFGPHRNPGGYVYPSTYHRESSFTPAERVEVEYTSTLLFMLAKGIALGSPDPVKPLHQRIKEKSSGKDAILGLITAEAVEELLHEFGRLYGPYLPALRANFQTAGALGTATAITHGELDVALIKRGEAPSREFGIFIGLHEDDDAEVNDNTRIAAYEDKCGGVVFGSLIMDHMVRAATNIFDETGAYPMTVIDVELLLGRRQKKLSEEIEELNGREFLNTVEKMWKEEATKTA